MKGNNFQPGDWVSWPNHLGVVKETQVQTLTGHTYLSVIVKSVYSPKARKWRWANYMDAVDAEQVERMEQYEPRQERY